MAKPKLGSGKRFSTLTKKLAKGGAKNPKALAAYIGRKKYGPKKFGALAKKGKSKLMLHQQIARGKRIVY